MMVALAAVALLLMMILLDEAGSSPSNGKQWCTGPQGKHNSSSFGTCAGFAANASGGFLPLPKASRHPVMFVPSMIGSNLYRKLHNSNEPYPICPNGGYFGGGGDWYRMWPPTGVDSLMKNPNCKSFTSSVFDMSCLTSLSDFIPLYADCWANDLTLQYDSRTDTYHDQRGITTVANGSIDVVAWQGPGEPPSDCTGKPTFGIPEYRCLGAVLDAAGYERGVEYDSLGWDWRKAPGDWIWPGGYFSQLKQAIETMRARNGGKPVILVSFSMGGPVTAVFLNRFVTAEWKQQNIYRWLSASGVFGGVQESLVQQINYAGSTTVPTMGRDASLALFQSWGSQNWMASTLAPNDVVVNVTGSRVQYLGKDVGELYNLIQKRSLSIASSKAARYTSETAPGVETYVFSGSGYPTPQAFEFPATPDGQPDLLNDNSAPIAHCVDGDSVATMESLNGVPQRWAAQGLQQGKKVEIVALPNASHGNDVFREEVARKLYQILM